MGLVVAETGGIPVRAAVGGDFYFDDVGFAGPCGAVDCDLAGSHGRTIERPGDHRLHVQCRERVSIFGLHRVAGLHRLVRQAVAGAHEVADKFGLENFDFSEPFAGCGADPAGDECAGRKAVVLG